MSYSLNSSKGMICGIIEGATIGVIKGDTRSLMAHMSRHNQSLVGIPSGWT